jgi:hypothetical protein
MYVYVQIPSTPNPQRHSSMDDDDFIGRPYLAMPSSAPPPPSSSSSSSSMDPFSRSQSMPHVTTASASPAGPTPGPRPIAPGSSNSSSSFSRPAGKRGRVDSAESSSSEASSVYPDVEQDNENVSSDMLIDAEGCPLYHNIDVCLCCSPTYIYLHLCIYTSLCFP